ncbi:MAG: FAD-dependent oxidoreductase [Synergistaceae bacterium]|nr:FAD-dependent oxidoreductase [Synergistaceae bacterium]
MKNLKKILVVGGGLAGCAAASRMAEGGAEVVIVEREPVIGGRVRGYGCKADAKCNHCGVCLTKGLWKGVLKNPSIETIVSSRVVDLRGTDTSYDAELDTPGGRRYVTGISGALVTTGFENIGAARSAHLQIEGTEGVATGSELEPAMRGRGKNGPFAAAPKSVAFIQCFGSRDKKERSNYCSRVCCAYSTRMARVIRHHYPDCRFTFFYMELQAAANADVFAEMRSLGADFVKCRPSRVTGGRPASVEYDDPAEGRRRRDFDMVVLSEGIHPARDNWRSAEVFGLELDENGFLRARGKRGVHVAGTAKRPMTIAETRHDAILAADAITEEL